MAQPSDLSMAWTEQPPNLGGRDDTFVLHVRRGQGLPIWQGTAHQLTGSVKWHARYWLDDQSKWQNVGLYDSAEEARTACENCARINLGGFP